MEINGKGNTRATAVFTIKYLRTFGFTVTNDLFADHSWYFRNALVRANYNDYKSNTYATLEYLNRFFGNLLLGESNSLKNRELLVTIGSGADVRANVPVKADNVRANVPVKADNVLVNVPVKRKDEIIKMLLVNPRLTAEKLAGVFSVTAKTISRDFTSLKSEGKVKRVGSDKTGHWEVIS